MRTTIGGYILAIVLAELIFAFVELRAGMWLHALILLLAITQYGLQAGDISSGDGQVGLSGKYALPALAMVPLLRISSGAMVVKGTSPVLWNITAGWALFLAALLFARSFGGLRSKAPEPALPRLTQIWIALSGPVLGLAGFYLFGSSLTAPGTWRQLLLLAAGATLFGGVLEELLFRGIIQGSLETSLGQSSVAWSTLLYVSVYLGTQSVALIAFAGITGLYFGWCALRTRAIAGVAVAHALMNLGIYVVYPLVLL